MATELALQKVRRLQARLAVHSDPKKLRKYLSKLSALPMTPDILAETGVRKTVKGFRKHQLLGTFAGDLAAHWKRLARGKSSLQATQQHWPPNREEPDDEDNHDDSHERQRQQEEEEEEDAHGGFWKPWPACEGQSHSPEHRRKRPRTLSTLEPHTPSQTPLAKDSDHDDQVQTKRQATGARACFPAQHFWESPTHQLWADSADLMALEPCTVQHEDREPAGGCQAPAQGPARALSLPQPQRPEDPEKAASSPKQKPAMFPRQDAHPPRPSAPEAPLPCHNPTPHGGASRHGKPQPPAAHSAQANPPKDTQHLATKLLHSAAAKPLDPQHPARNQNKPAMTFEQYMTYDYKTKKPRKAQTTWKVLQSRKASASQQPGKTAKQDSASTRQQVPSAPKRPRLKASQAEKLQPAAAALAELGTTPTRAQASPETQHSHRALQLLSCFPPARQAPSSPQPDEEVGFTGQRINTRMPVYSGPSCCTPTMALDPDPQCSLAPKDTRALSRTAAGVPDHVLQPILDKLTPQQLLHAEKANPQLVPETDAFWKSHCHRDFKQEKPQERESWREMYLRLQHAREQRLRQVTMAIAAAQANKQKGRHAKMVVFKGAAASTQAPARHSSHGGGFSPAPARPAPAARANAPSRLGATNPTANKPRKHAPLMAKAIRDFKKTCLRR